MPLNGDLVGKTYAPQTYEVSREKIREFAAAVGDANPAYYEVESARSLGHPDLVAPPTFAVVVTRGPQIEVIEDPAVGLDFSRVVHGDQKFEFSRPIVAGNVLTTTASISAAHTRAGTDFLTIRSDVRNQSGAPVVSVFATLVARAVEG
ncbi:MAG: MaoC family dehydratase N-terminal domain-containing protein [Actinomycetes bacterium]